jgi:kynurenine formamidase
MSFEGQELVDDYIERYSNWGRWGDEDSIGTLNFVGPEQVLAAVATVRHGRTVNCSLPLDQRGPQRPQLLRDNPRTIKVATGTDHVSGAQDQLPAGLGPANGFGRSDDITILPNQAGTAWDGLAHIFWKGHMWNGKSAALVSSGGAAANGVEHYAGKMVFRGVLLDMPKALEVESLAEARPITIEDLEKAEEQAGVRVGRGDCILLRTGFMKARRGNWGDYVQGPAPGLSVHTIPWLYEREVAAIAADTWGLEVQPNEIGVFNPIHIVGLVHMGLAMGEIFDFEELAVVCAELGQYEFLYVAPVLPITGASGSATGAIAIL